MKKVMCLALCVCMMLSLFQVASASGGALPSGGAQSSSIGERAVSYYSGTVIPTYTSVSGRALIDSYTDDECIYYAYDYNESSHFAYIKYLMDYCGWSYEGEYEDPDGNYVCIDLTNNNMWLTMIADFEYGETLVMFDIPSSVMPSSISLDMDNRTMIEGNQYTLVPMIYPSNANQSVIWSSSNPDVASVSQSGVVTAKSVGSATITAKTINGKTATCSITVKDLVLDYYPGTNIPTYSCITGTTSSNFSTDEILTMYGYEFDIDSYFDYGRYLVNVGGWTLVSEGTDENYVYDAVLKKGDDSNSVYILVYLDGGPLCVGYHTPVSSVTVTGVTLDKASAQMIIDDTMTLKATVAPANATNKEVRWSSSDSNVASVSENGVVTAKSAGTAIITVETVDGKKTAECTVTVKAPTPEVKVSSARADCGETVDIEISISNNPGINSMTLDVEYDSSAFTLIEVTDCGLLPGAHHSDVYTANPYQLTWKDDLGDNNSKNGKIVTLTFKVSDTAEFKKYPIKVTSPFAGIYNKDMDPVYFSVGSGSITVADYIPGDVNEDGVINAFDRTALARYVAQWDGFGPDAEGKNKVNLAAADVFDNNGDGVVNAFDRTILARHVAQWEGYETLPMTQMPR